MSRLPSLTQSVFLIALALAACRAPRAEAADATPSPRALTPAVRDRLDALAREQELEGLKEETINLGGNVTAWLVSQAALTARQEADQAARMGKQLLAESRAVPTPPAAERVWQRLVKQLPEYLKPKEFTFTLTVVEAPRPGVFTWGAGQVYITRPLLDQLLESPERGEPALAFLLAHQLGHGAYQHCRRGWQLVQIQDEVRNLIPHGVDANMLQRLLETRVKAAGTFVYLLYSRHQCYEADCFAWQLCRNAGFDLDAALDGLRYAAVVAEPRLLTDPKYRPGPQTTTPELHYYLSEEPEPLIRLKRLLMERDGQVADEKTYGLFCYDRASGELTRCEPHSVGAGEAPVVLVHGLRGDKLTFAAFLAFLGKQDELEGRPLLFFRFPNNESLAKCGRFLHNEMARVVLAPEKTTFLCHSAGGLVVRYYTEVMKGAFDRAILLATPNGGSTLVPLKYLVDLAQFAGALKSGLVEAIAATFPEGRGQITHDLHPDSLFYRHLGSDRKMAARYRVYYGQVLDVGQALALRAGFAAAKTYLRERVFAAVKVPELNRQGEALLDAWPVPDELFFGDGVVTVPSARLPGAAKTVRTRCNHLSILIDGEVMRQVVQDVVER
jgi:Zn-dependent protease with chaperone function